MSKAKHPYRVRCTITVTVQGGNASLSRTTREATVTVRAASHDGALVAGEREIMRRMAGRVRPVEGAQ
jgi:hypothetical protein